MENLKLALAYLDKLPVAQSGAGGHNATLSAALACRRFGLTEGETWEALTWYNDFRCSPKWTEKELRHKLASVSGIAVKKPLGQRGRGNRPTRAFIPPAVVQRVQLKIVTPIYFSDDPEQERLWLSVVTDLGFASVPDLDAFYDAEAEARVGSHEQH